MTNQFISQLQKYNLLQFFRSQYMSESLQLKLSAHEVGNFQWKCYLRKEFHYYNSIKSIFITNKYYYGMALDGQWFTNFNQVVLEICECHINPNIYEFSFQLGRIYLDAFCRLTTFLSDNCRFITSLCLERTYLGDESINLIAKAEWRYIVNFQFRYNGITSKGVKHLRKCEWKFINTVALSCNPLKNTGLQEFIRLHWRGLKYLILVDVGLTDDGVKIFARVQWPELIWLDLSKNQFTHRAVPRILQINWKKSMLIMFDHKYAPKKIKGNLQNLERKPNRDFISFGSREWEDQQFQ